MHRVSCVVAGLAGLLLVPCSALGKDKHKATLPDDVLRAQTVRVMIDPSAGVSLENPQANQIARRDVETALMNWGRYQPIFDGPNADLIIVVRRGTGKMSAGTIHDPRQNQRPAVIDPSGSGVGIGTERGQPPPYAGDIPDASQSGQPQAQNMPSGPMDNRPYPQIEGGSGEADDSFVVYRGKVDDPLDSPPVWRDMAKDCLKPHKVPAVDAFRKAVDEAEQAAAKQP
jgi:hypothetical protein